MSPRLCYLLTQDVEVLMGNWAHARHLSLPPSPFFDELSSDLSKDIQDAFSQVPGSEVDVELITHDRLHRGLNELLPVGNDHCLVSLDEVYVNRADYYLAINRMVSQNGSSAWQDIKEGARPGFPSVETQIKAIAAATKKPIVIVDDGGWTCGSLELVTRNFESQGAKVVKVVVGILIKKENPFPLSVEVESFLSYLEKSVKDWVCERDFFLGVPQGGRTVGFLNDFGKAVPLTPNTCVPYLLGFGHPEKWASLDLDQNSLREFSIRCIDRSIRLFEEIEKESGRVVAVSDIERLPYGIVPGSERFVDVLHREAKRIAGQSAEKNAVQFPRAV